MTSELEATADPATDVADEVFTEPSVADDPAIDLLVEVTTEAAVLKEVAAESFAARLVERRDEIVSRPNVF